MRKSFITLFICCSVVATARCQGHQDSIVWRLSAPPDRIPTLNLYLRGQLPLDSTGTYLFTVGDSLELDATDSKSASASNECLRIVWRQFPAVGLSMGRIRPVTRINASRQVLRFAEPGMFAIGVRAYEGGIYSREDTVEIRVVEAMPVRVQPAVIHIRSQGRVFDDKTAGSFTTLLAVISENHWNKAKRVDVRSVTPLDSDESITAKQLPPDVAETTRVSLQCKVRPGAKRLQMRLKSDGMESMGTELELLYSRYSSTAILIGIENAAVAVGFQAFLAEAVVFESSLGFGHTFAESSSRSLSVHMLYHVLSNQVYSLALSCDARQMGTETSQDVWRMGVGFLLQFRFAGAWMLGLGGEYFPNTSTTEGRGLTKISLAHDLMF
jgi:hypothetical protein